MEELVEAINRKKKAGQDYYAELLELEKEEGVGLVKVQVTYMLGVDFLYYEEKEKSFELLCSAFSQVIKLVYSTKGEERLLSSLIQKILIEFHKIHGVLLEFYEGEGRRCFRRMVGEFREVRRVLGGCTGEVFTYLLQVDPRKSLKFITREEEVDLLVEEVKKSGAYELLRGLEEYETVRIALNECEEQISPSCLLQDMEQVIFGWFITGKYQRIVDYPGKVSYRVLYISYSRLGLSLEIKEYEEGIGSSWDVEGEFLKEKIREKIRRKEDIPTVGIPPVDLLHLLREEGEYEILKNHLLEVMNKEMSVVDFRVLVSFLHLKEVGVLVEERLKILEGLEAPLSPSHRDWLGKVLFNNLLEAYESCIPVEYGLVDTLLGLIPTPESYILSLLLVPDHMDLLYSRFLEDGVDSPQASILFYEYGATHRLEINLSLLEDDCLLYLLGISHKVEKGVVLECHFRGILTQRHVEEILLNFSLRGTIPLYNFLQSISLKEYLSETSRDILTMQLKIVEYLKSPEKILFFRSILE